MITNQNSTWIASCDICQKQMATLAQTKISLSDEPDAEQFLENVGQNHFAVCDEHKFNQQTGEWE